MEIPYKNIRLIAARSTWLGCPTRWPTSRICKDKPCTASYLINVLFFSKKQVKWKLKTVLFLKKTVFLVFKRKNRIYNCDYQLKNIAGTCWCKLFRQQRHLLRRCCNIILHIFFEFLLKWRHYFCKSRILTSWQTILNAHYYICLSSVCKNLYNKSVYFTLRGIFVARRDPLTVTQKWSQRLKWCNHQPTAKNWRNSERRCPVHLTILSFLYKPSYVVQDLVATAEIL